MSRRRFGVVVLALVAASAASTVSGAQASAQSVPEPLADPAPSDPRATFVDGNATTCGGVGFGGSIQMGSPGNTSESDAHISGTVAPNNGTTQPGVGEELNIAILDPAAVIDAVVVKGGPAHNRYTNPAYLPPTLTSPQHYISPLNGGLVVPTISHWFVCYHLTTPAAVGSLTVQKVVVAPGGIPVEPVPTSVTIVVNCDDGNPEHEDVEVTFSRGGGRAAIGATIEGIPGGTTCTVVEQDVGALPAGSVVSFEPAGADEPGIVIEADTAAVVTVVNDLSGIQVQTATLQVTKTVVGGQPGGSGSFSALVECDDGTDTTVTFPGAGGPGSPMLTVEAGSVCGVVEFPVPAGGAVTYSVDGGPSTTTPPIVGPLESGGTVTIAITNTLAATSTTTTLMPSTTTTDGSGVLGGAVEDDPNGDDLADTGAPSAALSLISVAALGIGLALVGHSRRLRQTLHARRR